MSSGDQTGFLPEYANVRDASDEKPLLDTRYEETQKRTGHDVSTRDLVERVVSTARPVINRWIQEIYRIVLESENGLLTTFEKQRTAGTRTWDPENKWNKLRRYAETHLFPGYEQEIRYALLSPNGLGLSRYGDCSIELPDLMIAHRATLFETNSAAWWKKMTDIHGTNLPSGYRAAWKDRGRLGYVKLAELLPAPVTETAVNTALLAEDPDEADTFIEVHIFGSLSAHSAAIIRLPKAYEGSPVHDVALDKLVSMGVKYEGV